MNLPGTAFAGRTVTGLRGRRGTTFRGDIRRRTDTSDVQHVEYGMPVKVRAPKCWTSKHCQRSSINHHISWRYYAPPGFKTSIGSYYRRS